MWHNNNNNNNNKCSGLWKTKEIFSQNSAYSSKLEANCKNSCSRKRDLQKYLNGGRSSKDILSCEGEPNLPPGEVRVLEKFDVDMAKAANHKRKNSSKLLLIEEDSSDQCSVASCSPHRYNWNKAFEDSLNNSDAESSFPCSTYFEGNLEADIHELEFKAYKSTVRALYASGPLSWEQESLLTNLRLSLHISDEEHLLHLRHLLSL